MNTHIIMWISGAVIGYAVGFFVARSIYRARTWQTPLDLHTDASGHYQTSRPD